ncbi:Bacteriophytochrome cph2 [Acholeplasma oculi]|uniref:Diguanylate cyclase/Phosphodiesterase (GGDEF & EAL domains) with PAS sensor n=1 Tax=Acholeplasma oculi TaxID=35623 RepID=A0A061AFL2_9MOLU|nr:EAL domain-containing protein [Acholeplasma oculi]CDR30336.1 Diguanylate cyclase/Phosphodiesterase (GGDEF & EAL domains) with PAS sensor [Acholeplasma oculi]SKC42564.1 EAL domain, c-di-GMP-specific phosphodiesterase class I (or its enzymatically inactive variant) [Acholeplasma oculi]SUT88824.1 Bacteriophytochrome cph2 [Acholeplasma oculi]
MYQNPIFRRTLFILMIIAFSASYTLMHFFPITHNQHFILLALGALVVIGIFSFRGLGKNKLIFTISNLGLMGSLVIEIIYHIFEDFYDLSDLYIYKVIFHGIFSITYVIVALGLYDEFSSYGKNQRIKKVSFDKNNAILLDYDHKRKEVTVDISEQLVRRYKLSHPQFKLSLYDFYVQIKKDPSNQILKLDVKDIIELNLEGRLVTFRVSGHFNVEGHTTYLAFDYREIAYLQKNLESKGKEKLDLLKNLKVGVVEIELIFNESNKIIDYEIVYMNEAFEKISKLTLTDVIHKKMSIINPNIFKQRLNIYQEAYENRKQISFESKASFDQKWYNISVYPSDHERMVIIYSDVHEIKLVNEELEYLATHNRTNGLLNYYGMEKQIQTINHYSHAICFYITINKFEEFETFYDQRTASMAIDLIAYELNQFIDKRDILVNTKFFHYIMILIDPSEEKVEKVKRFLKESTYKKYPILDHEVIIKKNIGYTRKDDSTIDFIELIRQAQLASNAASKSEHNDIVEYMETFQEETKTNIVMAQRLNKAIEEKSIDVYFQKIINVEDNEVEYVEALARWIDPVYGFVSPEFFFNLATEAHLIDQLEQYIVYKTFMKFKEIKKIHPKIKLSMNISPTSIFNEGFDAYILYQAKQASLNPNDICIEISENTFVRDTNQCVNMIEKLKKYGFMIAIDDFGSKYSSFGILDLIPFDMIKLDGMFANKINQTSIQMMVKTLAEICKHTDKMILIERVEDAVIAQTFKELNVLLQQGYHHHRPEPYIGNIIKEEVL